MELPNGMVIRHDATTGLLQYVVESTGEVLLDHTDIDQLEADIADFNEVFGLAGWLAK